MSEPLIFVICMIGMMSEPLISAIGMINMIGIISVLSASGRHCEERSDEAIRKVSLSTVFVPLRLKKILI
jgi:hypothetical protein